MATIAFKTLCENKKKWINKSFIRKLYKDVTWIVLYDDNVFCVNKESKMATTAEISTIRGILRCHIETIKLTEPTV